MAAAYADTAESYGLADSQREQRLYEAAQFIISRLSGLAAEQVRAKALIEQRWLEDSRNYWGRYEETTEQQLKDEGRSTAFVKLTRHKTNSWAARLGDILFPTDDKNWGIKPTPVPMLVRDAKDAIRKAEAAVETANATTDPAQQDRIKEIADSFLQDARSARQEVEEAQRRCEAMEKTIDDQLIESDYVAQCRDVIEDMCRLGTGILKGPMTSSRLRAQWREQDGIWGLAQIPDPMPDYRRVDPWHFFPDMSAARPSEFEFTFERHLPTRKDMKRLARKLNFNRDAVGRVLKEGPRQLGIEVDHLSMLRLITGEGDPLINRFVMWEFHGSLECEEVAALLRAVGQEEKARQFEEEKDPLEDYRVILHFCNNEVLKIAPEYPMDSGESLYSVVNFEKGETSVFGLGVPNIMNDSQRAVNAAWRMMMDNAGLSVAPQILINRTAVTPMDGSYSLKPFKMWLLSSTAGVSPNSPAFQTFKIEMNTAQLQQIIELAKAFIDEETGMPTIAEGDQGAASKTLGGMSMLMNSGNVVFRRIVKGWDDDLTKPTIRRGYDWNMQFNPNPNIKGDMQVDARGSSVLLVRELQSQTLMNVMTNWSTHPQIGPWFMAKKNNVRPGLQKTLQTMMIDADDILATPDEYEEYQRKQEEAAANQPPENDPKQIDLQIAQLRLASAEKLATADQESQEKIEGMKQQIAVMELSAKTGQTQDQVRAQFGIKKMEIDSAERMHAVNIAVEDQRAQRAEQQGEDATAATGQGVG